MAEIPQSHDWSALPLELVELISKKIADVSDFVRFRCVCKPWRSAAEPHNLSPQPLPSSSMAEIPQPHDWSALPPELVELISKKIADVSDFVRFRCVCKPWRSAAKPQNLSPQQLPWLVLPYDRKSSARSFFRLSTRSIVTLDLPETRNRIICGSSNGWLLLLSHFLKFSLFNPLTRSLIDLPPITALPQGFPSIRNCFDIPLEDTPAYFNCDAFVSSVPNSTTLIDGVVIFAMEWSLIQYWKPGDGEWSAFDSGLQDLLSEIAFHKGKFYATDSSSNTAVGDLGIPGKAVVVPSLKLPQCHCSHLLALPDELLLVTLRNGIFPYMVDGFRSDNFECYKLEESKGIKTWSRLEGAGGFTMFLARRSFNFPFKPKIIGAVRGAPGFKSNCFYYSVLYRNIRRRDQEISCEDVFVLEQDEYLDGAHPCFLQGSTSITPILY